MSILGKPQYEGNPHIGVLKDPISGPINRPVNVCLSVLRKHSNTRKFTSVWAERPPKVSRGLIRPNKGGVDIGPMNGPMLGHEWPKWW